MARQASSPSFVVSVSLKTPRGVNPEALVLASRQLRQLEHRLLEWGLAKLSYIRNNIPRKRMNLIRGETDKDKRIALYDALWKEVGLTQAAMELYQQQLRKNYAYLTDQSALCQKLATKLFQGIVTYAIRKKGRPRFKSSKGCNLQALEAKELHSGIIVKPDEVTFNGITYELRWNQSDPHHVGAQKQIENYYTFQQAKKAGAYKEAINEAKVRVLLENPDAPTKALAKLTRAAVKAVKDKARAQIGPCATFGRLVFKRSQTGTKARLQVLCSGIAPMSHAMASTSMPRQSNTLDIGPTLIAHANEAASVVGSIDLTCEERLEINVEISRLQRQFKRMQKGGHNRTETANRIGFLQRKAVEVQQQAHAKLHLEILRGGSLLRKEDHGIKFLQRNRHYSRRIARNRPAAFLAGLEYKAAKAGGTMTEIDSGKAKLSQVCLFTDSPVKKPLGQRHHTLPNGVQVQRDHYSAWLGNFVDPVTGHLDRVRAKELWGSLGVETRLVEAWSRAVATVTANLKRKMGGDYYRGTLGHPPADRALSSTHNGCRQPCEQVLRVLADSPQQGRESGGLSGVSLPLALREVPETSASSAGDGAGLETPAKQ